jgi:site-specific recombinase XerD
VKNAFQGIASSQETLLKVFREHNEAFEKRIGVNRTKGTFRNYENSLMHLENFIHRKYHVCDLSFRQLDYSFIERYDYYLRVDCKMMPNTVLHRMICLQKMVKIAIRKKIISSNPFTGYSPQRPKTTQRYLPVEELKKMRRISLKSNALCVTRDMFVFSCFTGLSYIDLYNLTSNQIVKGDNGMWWLNISRQKTDSICKIPLMTVPLQLIEKYRGTGSSDRVFPMKSSRIMNAQLKKIAKLCGIERRLTFHMSRHTFGTETCLSQGVPLETVSKMMGHKKFSTTEIYAKVTKGKLDREVEILSKNISGKYVLAS